MRMPGHFRHDSEAAPVSIAKWSRARFRDKQAAEKGVAAALRRQVRVAMIEVMGT
jgi:hypothetical protein